MVFLSHVQPMSEPQGEERRSGGSTGRYTVEGRRWEEGCGCFVSLSIV